MGGSRRSAAHGEMRRVIWPLQCPGRAGGAGLFGSLNLAVSIRRDGLANPVTVQRIKPMPINWKPASALVAYQHPLWLFNGDGRQTPGTRLNGKTSGDCGGRFQRLAASQ